MKASEQGFCKSIMHCKTFKGKIMPEYYILQDFQYVMTSEQGTEDQLLVILRVQMWTILKENWSYFDGS